MFQGRFDFLFPPVTDYGNEYIYDRAKLQKKNNYFAQF